MNEPTKIVVMGEDPEKILRDYENANVIIIYPRNRRPTAQILLKKNVVPIFSDYATYPDIESLSLIRDTIIYLLNSSYITSKDRVFFIFEKNGEQYKLMFDMSKMHLPTLLDILSDRLDRVIVESLVKLSMAIVKKGREGSPVGALFIVGDLRNVKNYIVQKITNPFAGMEKRMRDITDDENFDTIREFAVMDGATLIDDRGFVVSAGVYVKNLAVDEWILDGAGGRHLAARSISKLTKAVSFSVSSEGTIRIYKDGKMIYELKDF